MKKFLAVLMVLVLSASLFAGAMAAEKVLTDADVTGNSTSGDIGLFLKFTDKSEEITTAYEATPVWNVVISEDELVWDITKKTVGTGKKTVQLIWDPESGTYSEGKEEEGVAPESEIKYEVNPSPKTVTLTNRSNFNVSYNVTLTADKQFSIGNGTGELVYGNNSADITITPKAKQINDNITNDILTVFEGTKQTSVTLAEGNVKIGDAKVTFTRTGELLYPYGTDQVNEKTTGN